MTIVCISGHAGAGKDYVGGVMAEKLYEENHMVLTTHYADLVKYVCTKFFDWDGRKNELGRTLLQHVGTDIVRAKDPNYWVDFIIDMLDFFSGYWEYVLIPDLRFPSEYTRLIEHGFHVIHLRVERSNYTSALTPEQQAHPSETSLDGVVPDYTIHNDGTVDELREKVSNFVEDILYERKD